MLYLVPLLLLPLALANVATRRTQAAAPKKKRKTPKSGGNRKKKSSKKSSNKAAPVPNPEPEPESSDYDDDGDDSCPENGPTDPEITTFDKKCKEMYSEIKGTVQTKFFRVCKFIMGDDVRTKAADKCFDLCEFQQNYSKPAWVKAYATQVNKAVNDVRGYACGEIKKKMEKYYATHQELPPLSAFEKCLMRTIDLDNEKESEIFLFYWDHLLDAACANKFDWCPDHRHYLTITGAGPNTPNNAPEDMYMNPSTEAVCLIILDNYLDLWREQFDWKRKNPNCSLPPTKKEENRQEGDHVWQAKTKYTDPFQGQQAFCGWSKVGQQAFDNYKKANALARDTQQSKDLEMRMLTIVKEVNNVAGNAPPPKTRAKKSDVVENLDTMDF